MNRAPILLFAATLIACGEPMGGAPSGSAPAGSSPNSTSSALVSGATAGSAAAPAPAPAIDEKAARALIDTWVTAQNKGDFAAYEKLYADKLEGIKRSGPRTWRFDRKGFLDDRERMFKRPMTVEVSDVTVTSGAASALVELKQRFKQDTFEDEGPKRLVVIEEKGALKIAREEMVQSALAGSRAIDKSPFRFVISIADKSYAVLDRSADVAWASGPAAWAPRRKAHPNFLVVRPAASAPPTATASKGRVLKLYDAAGASCEATVGDIALMSGGTPHFGEVHQWEGDPDPNGKPQAPVISLPQRAAEVFAMARPHLVGALAIPSGCVPAFALEGASPVFYKPAASPAKGDAAVRAATTAFRNLPSYRDNQKTFETTFKGTGEWAPTIDVSAFEGGTRRFLALKAHVVSGCADFNGTTTALLEIKDGRAVLVADNIGAPSAVFDSDGDGAIEIFSRMIFDDGIGRYIVTGPNGIASQEILDFPNNDCGC